MKIGWIGLGKLGMPCAEAIVDKGHQVIGYDIAEVKSDKVEIKETLKEVAVGTEIVFVAVPTPHEESLDGRYPTSKFGIADFRYDIVKSVLTDLNKVMIKDQLLVLISTVLPGTTRQQFIELVKDTNFVYNPYLIAMGSVGWDMVNPEMIMIGTEDGNENTYAKKLIEFYKTVMENNPRYVVGTWDECECIKVFYNTFISAKIGLVNMIQDVAERQGNINVDVVTEALAKSTQRIMGPAYMKAGMGDGGACHPRDNIALRYLADRLRLKYDLFGAIMEAREIQAQHMGEMLAAIAREYELPVYIHGKAYKPNVPYEEGSYSILVGSYVRDKGIIPIFIDPLTNNNIEVVKGVILLAHSAETTYGTEQKLYTKILPGSIVVDPWRKYVPETEEIRVIHYGNTRNRESIRSFSYAQSFTAIQDERRIFTYDS